MLIRLTWYALVPRIAGSSRRASTRSNAASKRRDGVRRPGAPLSTRAEPNLLPHHSNLAEHYRHFGKENRAVTKAIEKVQPHNALAVMEQEMETFMDKFFGRHPVRISSEIAIPSPNVEMFDKKDEIVVKAEVPGLDKPDIKVSLDGDLLTIEGEKKKETETKDEDYYFSERAYGAFSRCMRLPVEVQADKINANLNNGVLEVHLPKAEGAKPKQTVIPVK
jgi:HSP20 family protein